MNVLGWLNAGVDGVQWWMLTCAISHHICLFRGGEIQNREGVRSRAPGH